MNERYIYDTGETLYLPIMWFDDVIAAPQEDLMSMINEALSAGPNTSQKLLMFSGILLATQMFFYAAFIIWKKSGEPSLTFKPTSCE